jgi:hypothetical protein
VNITASINSIYSSIMSFQEPIEVNTFYGSGGPPIAFPAFRSTPFITPAPMPEFSRAPLPPPPGIPPAPRPSSSTITSIPEANFAAAVERLCQNAEGYGEDDVATAIDLEVVDSESDESSTGGMRECRALCNVLEELNPWAAKRGEVGAAWTKVSTV